MLKKVNITIIKKKKKKKKRKEYIALDFIGKGYILVSQRV